MEPEATILDRFSLDNIFNTFDIDSLETSHPVSGTVQHPDEIREIFDDISYGKGASIIRMMSNFLGQEVFLEGVTLYLNRFEYQNAVQDDLWQALTEVAHKEGAIDLSLTVKDIMDTWTLQVGYPVLQVERNYEENKATLTQKRFMPSKTDEENKAIKWWIPISYEFENGQFDIKTTQEWLSPEMDSFEIDLDNPDKAVVFNVQQTGYFRVNYDQKNWNLIINALESNPLSINRVNRGQILNDVFSLAKAGNPSYKTALDTSRYLQDEIEYIPWKSGLKSFSYIELMLQRSAIYGTYRSYLQSLMLYPYFELSDKPENEMTINDLDLYSNVFEWLCKLGYDECLKRSKDMFKQWMDSEFPDAFNPIDVTIRGTVYCEAIAQGDETEWMFLNNRFVKMHQSYG